VNTSVDHMCSVHIPVLIRMISNPGGREHIVTENSNIQERNIGFKTKTI
jgi:hypothetical protein